MYPFASRKLSARHAAWVTPLLLSLLMTAVVSLVSTLRLAGVARELLTIWPSAWALSWVVAVPVLLLALPVVRRLTALVVRQS